MNIKQKCKNCERVFTSSHRLRGHLAWCGIDPSLIESRIKSRITNELKQYNCSNCSKKFLDQRKRKFCSLKCNASTNKNKRLNKILYGKTVRELEEYRNKQIVCEICGRIETTKANRKKLAYDHDHDTGKFRGVLCFKCNTTFDYFAKYNKGFNNYLIKHSGF